MKCRMCSEEYFKEENEHCIEAYLKNFSPKELELINISIDKNVCFDCFRQGIEKLKNTTSDWSELSSYYEIRYKVQGIGISKVPRNLQKATIEEIKVVMKQMVENKRFFDFHVFKIEEVKL